MTPLSTYVNNLRERPAPVRERIAFLGALIITLAILLLWIAYGSWRGSLPIDNRPGPLDKVRSEIRLEWSRVERGALVLWHMIIHPFN